MGTTNSKPPGPIIMIDQSEILSSSQVQFITLLLRRTTLLCFLPAKAKCTNLVQKNQFPELNRHILTFVLSGVTYWESVEMLLVAMIETLFSITHWEVQSYKNLWKVTRCYGYFFHFPMQIRIRNALSWQITILEWSIRNRFVNLWLRTFWGWQRTIL